jgi:hypothetical protein
MRSAATFIFLSLIHLTASSRLTFSDGGNYTISSNYEDINIFVLNSTSLTLSSDTSYAINAPPSTDDGESVIRIENALLYANGGKIVGASGIGGSGVTITTDKDRDSKSYAIFEAGVEIIGGSASRESTTQGGNAVQIIQLGAEVCSFCNYCSISFDFYDQYNSFATQATFNGGKYTPGTGCTINVCGVQTDDGKVIQILYGKAIIKGGQFNGNIYSMSGDVEIHGCVEFDGERITGYLLDGAKLDVGYEGQASGVQIIFDETVCQDDAPEDADESSDSSSNGTKKNYQLTFVKMLSFILGALLSLCSC